MDACGLFYFFDTVVSFSAGTDVGQKFCFVVLSILFLYDLPCRLTHFATEVIMMNNNGKKNKSCSMSTDFCLHIFTSLKDNDNKDNKKNLKYTFLFAEGLGFTGNNQGRGE